ncbi:MAG: bifunctional 4-hydroxy-2-oxoglutarate aldolase/2-dehydro-3-deoxy-phosphogluconate aldolase [Clostridium sp.]|jgi:2-dehydro-3-deoxyphosphogluconate aldolase/(4S)-4-hydroxy-2-oxoglutarate aldolase|nr:bifunctional 4-hydroxy-2-oxoglutarate aldolase/2-dehydro-3-deoxy-phosphogluconate aldolase [Clostridium sp.]
MDAVIERLSKIGLVPVVKIERVEDAIPLAQALCAGGLPCAEVTFRTESASGAIKAITEHFPTMCVGAGTVLTAAQVDAACGAGAQFIVSPGLNPKTVKYCVEKEIPITPGVSTPSDIEAALELGLEVVKFFPAEQAGGLPMIKALAAPYGSIKFLPTGGISAQNLNSYLSYEKVIACGGSWMVPADLINAGKWGEIERLTREAVRTMLGFSLSHVRIPTSDEREAHKVAQRFGTLFGLPISDEKDAVNAGGALFAMKNSTRGAKGTIAIQTNYLTRAMYYLENVLDVKFDASSAQTNVKGKVTSIYLDEEMSGFALMLVQKA